MIAGGERLHGHAENELRVGLSMGGPNAFPRGKMRFQERSVCASLLGHAENELGAGLIIWVANDVPGRERLRGHAENEFRVGFSMGGQTVTKI